MARSEGGVSPAAGCNDRATPLAALLPRAGNGCVDFGAGRRCALGRDRSGYRRCASRLGQRQNPQQRDPPQYFNSLLNAAEILLPRDVFGRYISGSICENASETFAFDPEIGKSQSLALDSANSRSGD